ncbi:MAG: hypothetical protein HKN77_05190, partial [Woeseiaceae bacterium]|nr:hypothetical protein [Woeseiaceae bacterium]
MRRQLLTLLTGLLLCQAPAALLAAKWSFDDVGRIVAIADVHGAFEPMVQTLRNGSVIDASNRWIAGDTHLVVVGDLLDRGPDSRKVMDLLMALELEAERAGGKAHVLIGNHEVMNLVGDLRYVAMEEYAAFASEESAADRQRGFAAWRDLRTVEGDDDAALQERFDEAFPPGFFAHRRAFGPDGRYGRWLLQKPILIVVNETAFVHGGLSPLIQSLGLDGVNGRLMDDVREYVDELMVLERAGVLLPTDSFYEHESLLANYLPTPNTTAEVLAAIEAVTRLGRSHVHALDGPLWYRGNVACNRLIEQDRLEETLASIAARRVVIGHTPTPTRRALQRFDGRVIEIDTGMLNDYYQGRGHALVVIGDAVGVVSEQSADIQPLLEHQRLVGMRPSVYLSAEDIERLLEAGDIANMRDDELNRRI